MRIRYMVAILVLLAFYLDASRVSGQSGHGSSSSASGSTTGHGSSSGTVSVGGKTVSIDQAAAAAKAASIDNENIGQLIQQFEQLSPEDQQKIIDALATTNNRGPRTQNTIGGPNVPATYVTDYSDLKEASDQKKLNDSLISVAWDQMQNLVMIQRAKTNAFSDREAGNGILLNPTAVLTVRHIAKYIDTARDSYKLIRIGRPDSIANFFQHLQVDRVVYLQDTSLPPGDDPDLAIIIVKPVKELSQSGYATPATVIPAVNQALVSVGCGEFETLPKAATGIATTASKSRDIGDVGVLMRTAMGSTLRSFPGVSGSPVFDSQGHLTGIVVGGVKVYAGTGETVTNAPKSQEWETFKDWTWVTPIAPYLKSIIALATPKAG